MNLFKKRKIFKVLSIDGGGIKGLYSSRILEHLEDQFQCRLSDYFDLICGTSTGGLIALGLSLRMPAKRITSFYTEKGGTIFPNRTQNVVMKRYDKFRQTLWKGKFSNKALIDELKTVFGDHVIGDSNNYLCIPSYSVTEAKPWVFKFDHSNLSRDNKTSYVDVALATSAAPTYFPMVELSSYDNRQFIDGGVWANNPTLVGYLEALNYFVGENKAFTDLSIMSISSLSITGGKQTGLKKERSFIDWGEDLFEVGMTGQSRFVDTFMTMAQKVSEIPLNYVRIPSAEVSSDQENLIKLDNATPNALNLISGKGNDQGLIYRKREEIHHFFKEKKLSKIK